MKTFDKNISDVYQKLQKIRGSQQTQSNISELQTFIGTYRGNSILEGFRANTEYMCNEKNDIDEEGFSNDFVVKCKEDLNIINDISEYESLKIPPISLEKMQQIVKKELKLK